MIKILLILLFLPSICFAQTFSTTVTEANASFQNNLILLQQIQQKVMTDNENVSNQQSIVNNDQSQLTQYQSTLSQDQANQIGIENAIYVAATQTGPLQKAIDWCNVNPSNCVSSNGTQWTPQSPYATGSECSYPQNCASGICLSNSTCQ